MHFWEFREVRLDHIFLTLALMMSCTIALLCNFGPVAGTVEIMKHYTTISSLLLERVGDIVSVLMSWL